MKVPRGAGAVLDSDEIPDSLSECDAMLDRIALGQILAWRMVLMTQFPSSGVVRVVGVAGTLLRAAVSV